MNRYRYTRHGGPYDRGAADSWYRRPFNPHYYEGAAYQSREVPCREGSENWKAYKEGYDDNERDGLYKDWG